MTLGNLLAFNIALLVAIASPGPALLVAIRTTLSAGRAAGIAIGCGLGTMAATWTLMALLGLEAVFRLFPWMYAAAQIVGGLYLIYVAIHMWKSAKKSVDGRARTVKNAFFQGLAINLFNPKSVLFSAAILIAIFPAGMSFTENAVIAMNHLLVEFLFYAALALGMSTGVVSNTYLKMKIYIDRAAAVVLGSLGLRLLANR